MIDQLLELIVDEGKWLTASMGLALASAALLLLRLRGSMLVLTRRIMAAMNLVAGVTIGTMAAGHLLAVGTKLALGTLRDGSLPMFITIGVVLLVPSLMVVRHTGALLLAPEPAARTTMLLNGWLAISLLVLGLHNVPLAAQAMVNMAYRTQSGRVTGWIIVAIAIVFNVALFAASLVFMASGQSFEQFSGIE